MTKLDEALGLFPSCIKSGENWSPTCQAVLDAARQELAALRAPAVTDEHPPCSKCGSKGDTFVLCAGCHEPLSGPPAVTDEMVEAAYTASFSGPISREHIRTILTAAFAAKSSPAPVLGSLPSGESDPSVMPDWGAGGTIRGDTP